MWRASYIDFDDSCEDSWDPWGSDAVHASLCRALHGTHYDRHKEVSLSVEMASFYFHVLTLAMEDRNLQGNERLVLVGELKGMERKIKEWQPYMRRLNIQISTYDDIM
jgi:hypothetical protein